MKIKIPIILLFLTVINQYIMPSVVSTRWQENVNPKDWFIATINQDLILLQNMASKIDVNIQDYGRYTALIYAAHYGYEHIVRFLLTIPGINVNLRNEHNVTALMASARQGYSHVVKLLLQVPEISINQQDKFGNTPLLHAVFSNNIETVQSLLNAGAHINIRDNRGFSALMVAVWQHNIELVQLLLQFPDIEINACDTYGQTALDKAVEQNYQNIIYIIKNKKVELTQKAFRSIQQNNKEVLRLVLQQLGDTIIDNLLDKAFAANKPEIIFFLLTNTKDPQKLLARFPFEHSNPASPIFKYIMALAYGEQLQLTVKSIKKIV